MNLAKQIQQENKRFELINKCSDIYYESLQEVDKLKYFPYYFKNLFENKSIRELQKYIKTVENLKKIQLKNK